MKKQKTIRDILPLSHVHYVEAIIRKQYPNLPTSAYFARIEDMIYKNRASRFYLSNWLEQFIIKYAITMYEIYECKKVDNKAKVLLNRRIGGKENGKVIGALGYAKNPNIIEGEPDVRLLPGDGRVIYFEVKIGNDRLSEAQKAFIMQSGFMVYVVSNVPEVVEILNSLDLPNC